MMRRIIPGTMFSQKITCVPGGETTDVAGTNQNHTNPTTRTIIPTILRMHFRTRSRNALMTLKGNNVQDRIPRLHLTTGPLDK
jgi:hypothetical protein